MKSRILQNSSNDPSRQPGETVYCICRRPDTGKWMIGCDGCDDWFHGECVQFQADDEDLVDQYFCPNCQEKGLGPTTWKRKCRLPSCRSPAAVTNTPPSKYCSPEHGLEFFRSKQRLAEYSPGELSAVVGAVHDAASFQKLGDNVTAPESPTVRAKIETLLLRDAEILEPMKKAVSRRQTRLETRSRYISMVKDRQKRVADELRGEADQTPKGIKELCAFDIRLALDDDEFADWCDGEEGKAVFLNGHIDGREGLCMKRKCEKHKYWLRIAMEDLELEGRLVNESAAAVLSEENGMRQRHNVKSLMEYQRSR
ncbi:hypothetical protein DRE_01396 [Drechslerella stenobrocha 248]|uniref:PHD-type domain-containing protein n=1 Tax=Drechslerella stenobrocha 248 TaxID=1043628 RepID=W7HLT5_9PEZI|nr:hypothetical protein DRE_01396 [Drechslerella stenobrocha 248]